MERKIFKHAITRDYSLEGHARHDISFNPEGLGTELEEEEPEEEEPDEEEPNDTEGGNGEENGTVPTTPRSQMVVIKIEEVRVTSLPVDDEVFVREYF